MTVAGPLQTALSVIRVGGRTFLSGSSNPVPGEWQHVTKVDPEEGKRLPIGYPFYLQHTDGVSVGGSSSVTARNTEETFSLLSVAETPAFHEPSEARHVTESTREMAAFLAVPEVVNGDTAALVGTLGEGIEYLNDEMIPESLASKLPGPVYAVLGEPLVDFATSWLLDRAVFEAYVVQNPESAAARRSGVTEDDVLSPAVARQRAMVADRHLDSEVVYVEYSGTYGGDEAAEVLRSISGDLTRARVWYGGGIDSRERSTAMLDAGADTVVVGDVFHDVADEEARIVEGALEALDRQASPGDVRTWVRDEVDVESTNAARFLRTIPGVEHPESVAERYISLAVGLSLLASAGDPDASREAVDRSVDLLETVVPDGPQQARDALAGGDSAWERYVTDVVLPAGGAGDTGVPVHHLSLADLETTRGCT